MLERQSGFTRRQLLATAGLISADLALSGCHASYVLRTGQFAPPIESSSPLTIDVHCHIFNGTDLPAYAFLTEAFQIPPAEAKFAADIIEIFGMQGEVELKDLKALVEANQREIKTSGKAVASAHIASATKSAIRASRSDTYKDMHKKILAILRRAENAQHASSKPSDLAASAACSAESEGIAKACASASKMDSQKRLRYIDAFRNNSAEGFKAYTATGSAPAVAAPAPAAAAPAVSSAEPAPSYNLLGVIAMLFQYCCGRFVCAQDYLDTFCPDAHRGVDLMLASMVDYDWWLNQGAPTPTTLSTQRDIMKQISILSGGRVHGFIPFDPLRAVAYKAGKPGATWCPLKFAQEAVESYGFVGVKLYPTMGFAPYGNKALDSAAESPRKPPCTDSGDGVRQTGFWDSCLLPAWLSGDIGYPDGTSKKLGARLDDALDELYTWCTKENVPILAHSNETNGTEQRYKDLAGAQYWKLALQQYKDLRVNFGHLGGLSNCLDDAKNCDPSHNKPPQTSLDLINLMGPAGSPGENAFGDAAFMESMLRHPAAFDELVQQAYADHAILKSRFLFGTDWSLLMEAGGNKPYLEQFVKLFAQLGPAASPDKFSPSDRFFGVNAMDYIGLRPGDCARKRLDDFYTANSVPPPEWTAKVAGLLPQPAG